VGELPQRSFSERLHSLGEFVIRYGQPGTDQGGGVIGLDALSRDCHTSSANTITQSRAYRIVQHNGLIMRRCQRGTLKDARGPRKVEALPPCTPFNPAVSVRCPASELAPAGLMFWLPLRPRLPNPAFVIRDVGVLEQAAFGRRRNQPGRVKVQ